MGKQFEELGDGEQRGSKPRCHLLTHGTREEVAERLTKLASGFATVSVSDRWMPQGFAETEEAQLHRATRLVDARLGEALHDWWLAVVNARSRTPTIDIASTCTVAGEPEPGLLIIEAKAHDKELKKEIVGKRLKGRISRGREANHERIGVAIASARAGLSQATSQDWGISRDACYQMSNRFAWAWKVTELGRPVVLIYLGFLNADEMKDRGNPFRTDAEWTRLVHEHGQRLVPEGVWGKKWKPNGRAFIPLIKATEVPLSRTAGS